MATLYRKYRPVTFGEIVGQKHVTRTLQAAIEQDKVTHAYLFHGPRGTGKTTTARLLAKRINCESPNKSEPCNQCSSCRALMEGRHIDIIEIDAASNRGIDDIRALRERVQTAPSLGKFKVYIIDEVHMLTNEAASALLKTLEEPAKHVIFILATTEFHKVLPTILSRCQVYRFRRASDKEIKSRLRFLLAEEKREAEDEVLQFIADRSEGCFRDAESLLGQLLTMREGKIKTEEMMTLLGLPSKEELGGFLDAMLKGDSGAAIRYADEAFKTGHDPEQFLKEAIHEARDSAIEKIGQDTEQKWVQIIRSLLQALQDLAFVPQPMIAVHLAILSICQGKRGPAETREAGTKTSLKTAVKAQNNKEAVEKTGVQADTERTDLEVIKAAWPKVIEAIKQGNPVASTFLRAVEPIALRGSELEIRTRYSLHQTFFEKEDNKKLVAEKISAQVKVQLDVRFIFDEANASPIVPLAKQRKKEEGKLLKTVKEVFG